MITAGLLASSIIIVIFNASIGESKAYSDPLKHLSLKARGVKEIK